MLDNAGLLKKCRAFVVSQAVYRKNRTVTRLVVGKTPCKASHGRKPSLKDLRVFGCLAFVHVPKEKRKKLDSRGTLGIFAGYSISTNQYFVYDPLGKTLHRFRDVVCREGKRYTAPNAADKAIVNEHFYRDVNHKSKPTEKQPTRDDSSERQMEEPLENDPPPDPLYPTKKSADLAALETSLGDTRKPPAEGSHRNCAGKNQLAESAQLTLEDEEFEDIHPIYAAAPISDNQVDGIDDPSSYKAATESPLADQWDMAMKEQFDASGQHQVFGDFLELPEERKALPCHCVYKIQHDGAGNVQRFKTRLVCGRNHQIEGIDYQATYALTAGLGHNRLALAITTK